MKVELNEVEVRQAIIEQAVDQILGNNIYEQIEREASKRINEAIAKRLDGIIEDTLNTITREALDTEIHPINIWGEREGNPTTVRAALHNRAKSFWQEKVNKNGEKTSYGGVPRYEHVLGIITAKEFESVIKQNITDIAGAVKDAIRSDFYSGVDNQLNKLFKVKSAGDK